MRIVRFCVQFSGVLAIFVGKTKKGWAADCKSLHKSKKCLTSLMKFDVIVLVLVTLVWKLA